MAWPHKPELSSLSLIQLLWYDNTGWVGVFRLGLHLDFPSKGLFVTGCSLATAEPLMTVPEHLCLSSNAAAELLFTLLMLCFGFPSHHGVMPEH